ncbi:MAG: M61 family metallopeptidase [Planctomycetota bacterium]
MPQLAYRIDVSRAAERELDVVLDVTAIEPGTQDLELFMPTWTPGSYLLREYSRHLSTVSAVAITAEGPGGSESDSRELACRKTSKTRFAIESGGHTALRVRYRVYAHELSVRTAHADDRHAFWTPAAVLLWPVDARNQHASIAIVHPEAWSVFCSLEAQPVERNAAGRAITTLAAPNLDAALDAPVLVGAPQCSTWTQNGVPHTIVLDALDPVAVPESLTSDLVRIVDVAADVFGGALPYREYTFLALFAGEGYGGLEHCDSSVLLMPRTSLASERGYRDFLALAAHELFHAWNVKRMRPEEFWVYDYEHENYTRLLWVMEGWTAYYDDLLLVRAGLMSHDEYLGTMARNVQNMHNAPGRFERSLEQSSYDAWIRLYRPDENTRNSSQNYYGNGAVVAMCLDLSIRRSSEGAHCLDDVLRLLYTRTFEANRGYRDDDIYEIVHELAGPTVVAELRSLVTGKLDPQLAERLVDVGVQTKQRETGKPYLGVVFEPGTTKVSSVTKNTPAYHAQLAPGDEVLAVRDARTKASNWQKVFAAVAHVDQPCKLLVDRGGIVQTLTATPIAHPGTIKLSCNPSATPPQIAARTAWLGAVKGADEEQDSA